MTEEPNLNGNLTLGPPGYLYTGLDIWGRLSVSLLGGGMFSLFSTGLVKLFQSVSRGASSKLRSISLSPSMSGTLEGPGPPPVARQDLV